MTSPTQQAELAAAGAVTVRQLALAQRLRQQLLASRMVAAARRWWSHVDPTRPQASWAAGPGAQVQRLLEAAQLQAASGADTYVATALSLAGAEPDPAYAVIPAALAGVASDGRDLTGLLSFPAYQVSQLTAAGMSNVEALSTGQHQLERMVVTQVQDASRVAASVAMVNDHAAGGYIRVLIPPSCSRCVVLAGRWYAVDAGFQRHPLCDCIGVPAAQAKAAGLSFDPASYFRSLSQSEQDDTFGKAGAQAIRDGADLARVVNARRGMYTAGGRKLTREATKKRPRLMPEQIYLEAHGNRAEAIRLLRLHGYLR